MPVINTQAFIEISAPVATVQSVIVNFRTWPIWSRGLAMLKDYVEEGEVHSRCTIEGVVNVEAVDYVGYTATIPMSQITETLKTSFGHLYSGSETGALIKSCQSGCALGCRSTARLLGIEGCACRVLPSFGQCLGHAD